jgi:hypothetical protein
VPPLVGAAQNNGASVAIIGPLTVNPVTLPGAAAGVDGAELVSE